MVDAATTEVGPFPVDVAAALLPRGDCFATGEDNLRITCVASVGGLVVTTTGRLWDPVTRTIVPFSRDTTPAGDRTVHRDVFSLGVGFLLDATIRVTAGAPTIGQLYCALELVRGSTTTAPLVATLCADGVTANQGTGWPGGAIHPSTSIEPAVRNIAGTTPALGGNVSETCPTGARWELITVFCRLVTDGTAVDRHPFMQVNYNGVPGALYPSNPTQLGGVLMNYTFTQNALTFTSANVPANTSFLAQRQFLRAGDSFLIAAVNQQPGDQWSLVEYQVREWLEVN